MSIWLWTFLGIAAVVLLEMIYSTLHDIWLELKELHASAGVELEHINAKLGAMSSDLEDVRRDRQGEWR